MGVCVFACACARVCVHAFFELCTCGYLYRLLLISTLDKIVLSSLPSEDQLRGILEAVVATIGDAGMKLATEAATSERAQPKTGSLRYCTVRLPHLSTPCPHSPAVRLFGWFICYVCVFAVVHPAVAPHPSLPLPTPSSSGSLSIATSSSTPAVSKQRAQRTDDLLQLINDEDKVKKVKDFILVVMQGMTWRLEARPSGSVIHHRGAAHFLSTPRSPMTPYM